MQHSDFYAGVWTNWGKGRILGLTLTVSNRDGGILISFLTMFVRLIGNHCWNIISFVLHQSRSSTRPQDGLFYQQQATLRNAASQSQALWKMGMLAGFWRGSTQHPLRRSFPITSLILFHLTAFTLAGLFTSRLIASSNETLVPVGVCGPWSETSYSYEDLNAYQEYRKSVLQWSAGYTTNCYGSTPGNRFCTGYAKREISTTIDSNASCPFADPDTCLDPANNIQIDTGLIDSDRDLGINAPPENRIQYRKVVTCAPVDSAKWVSGVNSSTWATNFVEGPLDALPGEKSMYFYFGPQANETGILANYTYAVSNYSRWEASQIYDIGAMESILDRKGFYSGGRSFLPNSTFFNQTDQDVTLLFLSNNALYTAEVEDLWFSASRPNPLDDYGFGQLYSTNYFGGAVMACMDQHSLCKTNLNGSDTQCTALTGRFALMDLISQANDPILQLNAEQNATATRLLSSVHESSTGQVVLSLGASSLLAQSYANWGAEGFTSAPVPAYQWQLEVWNWHNIAMANMQQWAIEFVTGPRNRDYDKYIVQPDASLPSDVCSNQRQRSDDAMSFNVLGVVVILGAGCFIIVTNLSLPIIVGFIQDRFDVGTHRRMEWALDEVLQLQRMAFQRSGSGTWRKTQSIVPLSALDEKFQHLRQAEGFLYSPPSRESVSTEYHYFPLKS